MSRIRQDRKLPPNASQGQKRLSVILDEIFRCNGADMTIIYEMPLNKMAEEDICDSYGVNGMSVDFYIKELRMAIEFQGSQHYATTPNGFFGDQVKRDNKKRDFLKDIGITLIEIPHTIGKDFTVDDIKYIMGF